MSTTNILYENYIFFKTSIEKFTNVGLGGWELGVGNWELKFGFWILILEKAG
jgi:hypothetical protein